MQNQIPWGMVTFKVSVVRLRRFKLSEGLEVTLRNEQRETDEENKCYICSLGVQLKVIEGI